MDAWIPRTIGGSARALGQGCHLTEGLLTLHNLMGDAGINAKQKNPKRTLRYVRYAQRTLIIVLLANWLITSEPMPYRIGLAYAMNLNPHGRFRVAMSSPLSGMQRMVNGPEKVPTAAG